MRHIENNEKKKNGLFILLIMEITGIITGTVLAFSDFNTEKLKESLCPALNGSTLFEIFSNTFIISVLFLVIAFFSGLFAFGQPLGIALIILKGIETGLISAFMYSENGLSAFYAVLALNVPKAVSLSFIAILAVREMWRSSSAIFDFLISEERKSEKVNLKLYCIKFIVLVIIVFFISIADALMNYIFAGLL